MVLHGCLQIQVIDTTVLKLVIIITTGFTFVFHADVGQTVPDKVSILLEQWVFQASCPW